MLCATSPLWVSHKPLPLQATLLGTTIVLKPSVGAPGATNLRKYLPHVPLDAPVAEHHVLHARTLHSFQETLSQVRAWC